MRVVIEDADLFNRRKQICVELLYVCGRVRAGLGVQADGKDAGKDEYANRESPDHQNEYFAENCTRRGVRTVLVI